MAEQYVKAYNVKFNEEEAESLEYLKKNGWNIHKLIKNYISSEANRQRAINEAVAQEIGD